MLHPSRYLDPGQNQVRFPFVLPAPKTSVISALSKCVRADALLIHLIVCDPPSFF